MITIRKKVYGSIRSIGCMDKTCPSKPCWQPHDCPVQGCGGVRESTARWMCLTNVLQGCPSTWNMQVDKAE